jgi:hypothetical protein
MDLTSLLSSGTVAADALAWTADSEAALQAGAYSAWVEAITGSPAQIRRIGTESRAQIVLSDDQVLKMRQWLSGQVGGMISADQAVPAVELDIGRWAGPWAVQYAGPLIIGAVVVGWMANYFLGGRK